LPWDSCSCHGISMSPYTAKLFKTCPAGAAFTSGRSYPTLFRVVSFAPSSQRAYRHPRSRSSLRSHSSVPTRSDNGAALRQSHVLCLTCTRSLLRSWATNLSSLSLNLHLERAFRPAAWRPTHYGVDPPQASSCWTPHP
jgi:hypothetical protein